MPLPTLPLPTAIVAGDPNHPGLHNDVNSVGNYLVSDTQTKNRVLASPDGSNGAGSFRALVQADLPTITPAVFGSQTQNLVLAAPNGSSGNPTFRALVLADLPTQTGTGNLVLDTSPTIVTPTLSGFTFAKVIDTNTGSIVSVLSLAHDVSSGTPAAGMGVILSFVCQSTTTNDRLQGRFSTEWSDATDATRTALMKITLANNGGTATPVQISPTTVTLSSDLVVNNITIGNAKNITFNTSTGTIIGTGTTQKFAFWNATPVTQRNTTGTATGFTAGAGTNVTDQSTFTGGTGATAYRISDIVLALKQLGLMAS